MTTPTFARRRSTLTALLVVTAGLAVGGCDERDATVAAIDKARLALDKISLPTTPIADGAEADRAEAALTSIVSDLRPLTSEGSTGQKQAASLLVAQAQLGIADRRAAFATVAERQFQTSLTPIRLQIDAMLTEASRSTALLAYNPAPAIEQIQALITSKDAEIAQRQRDRAQIEADILMLRQGAEERMTMGAARRDEAARLSVQAMALPAADAGRMMEDVHRIRREADKIELDGANLLARAEVRQPELNEREMLVQQVVSQKQELEAALALTRQRATEAQAAAAEHAAACVAAAEQLDQMIQAAIAHRNDAANPRVDAAAEAYAAALTSARAAGPNGTALVGAAAQGRADMMWLRAQSLQVMADLLEQIAGTPLPPALNQADRAALQGTLETYASDAERMRAAQREALAAAAEGYGEARDAFQRVRGEDDASRARVNRLAQLMHLCRRAANGAAIDLSTITDEQGDFTEEAPAEPAGEEPIEDTGEGMEAPATEG